MYTFALTMCAMIAVFGVLAIVCGAVVNRLADFEDGVSDYENE